MPVSLAGINKSKIMQVIGYVTLEKNSIPQLIKTQYN